MANLIHYVADIPYLDQSKAILAGASFGGYMVSWMFGQDIINKVGLHAYNNPTGTLTKLCSFAVQFGTTASTAFPHKPSSPTEHQVKATLARQRSLGSSPRTGRGTTQPIRGVWRTGTEHHQLSSSTARKTTAAPSPRDLLSSRSYKHRAYPVDF